MLTRNPITRTSNQIQVVPAAITKDTLQGSTLWRVEGNTCHIKMQCPARSHHNRNLITYTHVTQEPENSRKPSWTIQMSINDCTTTLTR